jgi:hypothetical protein
LRPIAAVRRIRLSSTGRAASGKGESVLMYGHAIDMVTTVLVSTGSRAAESVRGSPGAA